MKIIIILNLRLNQSRILKIVLLKNIKHDAGFFENFVVPCSLEWARNHGPIVLAELERLNATLVNHNLELTVFAGESKNEAAAIVNRKP